MSRLNILYLHSHDTGRYIEPYGHNIPTPNLRRLAESGVLFRQAFCAAPTCSPSRAALLTGQCAHSSGMLGLAHRGFDLYDRSQHIVHALHNAGYTSALIGEQHVARDPHQIGYQRVVECPSGHVWDVVPRAVEFLASAPQQPFFLDVGFNETHRVYPPPDSALDANFIRPPAPLPDTPETRYDMACFKASVRQLDEGVGAVLDALERAGLAENTLVVSTTDHGIAFPGMKCTLTDHGIGVSFILRGPSIFGGGRVVDALISQVDLFPTLCEVAGAEKPAWLQGVSFLPVLRGEVEAVRSEIYAEVTYHAAYEPQRAVRTQRYKYIRRFEERSSPVLPNVDDSPSKEVLLRGGWAERAPQPQQLYDLLFDPNESCNLIDQPQYQAVAADLRARLEAWMQSTHDPLLQGPVPAPVGALVNRADGISPEEPPERV
ncbi:MAG: sulfatase [Anaerolineaceae bacterium]|nr:sulfatase [Anaerolineaceae bacterium]